MKERQSRDTRFQIRKETNFFISVSSIKTTFIQRLIVIHSNISVLSPLSLLLPLLLSSCTNRKGFSCFLHLKAITKVPARGTALALSCIRVPSPLIYRSIEGKERERHSLSFSQRQTYSTPTGYYYYYTSFRSRFSVC